MSEAPDHPHIKPRGSLDCLAGRQRLCGRYRSRDRA